MGSRAGKLWTGGIAIIAFALVEPPPAAAQKQGGTLRIYNRNASARAGTTSVPRAAA